MKIILSGGTGFIGKPLVRELLGQGHNVVILTRHAAQSSHEGLSYALWDGRNQGAWSQQVDGADAVINLAGESIGDKRWTKSQKEKILQSRLSATNALVTAITAAKQKPEVLISGSAVGYYGSIPEGNVTEDVPAANDLHAQVCKEWENAAQKAETLNVRVVCLRTGIVLEKDGGALKRMLLPFKLFAGGPIGSGKQWMPWIHREDMLRAIMFVLENRAVRGPVNMTAPEPVRMREFAKALGKAMRRPSLAPVPGFVLKIILGELSVMVLTGQRALPKKLQQAGFQFTHPNISEALSSILSR